MQRVIRLPSVMLAVASGAVLFMALTAPGEETGNSIILELLEDYGIGESQLRHFNDRQPFSEAEYQTLYRVLFRLPYFGLDVVESEVHRDAAWDALIDNPTPFRGQFFRLSGRIHRVQTLSLPEELAERLRFRRFYRVTIQLVPGNHTAVIYVRRIPRAWKRGSAAGARMDERGSVNGMFLKVGESNQAPPSLVFAADRMAWHPDRVNEQLRVEADHVLLGDLGMDVGRLDDVDDGKALQAVDRECFYQMLSAVGAVNAAELRQRSRSSRGFAKFLKEPESHHGRLYEFHGTARRAIRIRVDDPDIRSRFGIDHYYEIEVFVPLEVPIRFVDESGDGEPRLFRNYPVTFCVRKLPAEMPEGELILEEVKIVGFYFKLWAYPSQFMSAASGTPPPKDRSEQRPRRQRRLQISPLFIGVQPVWIDNQPASFSAANVIFGGLFALILIVAWCGIWWWRRGDRQFTKSTLSRQFQIRDPSTLDRLAGDEQVNHPRSSKVDLDSD